MRSEIRSLEIFLTVAEQGGVGAAARALGIAQPTVSAALLGLEKRLGVPLIERSPRGSHLTVPGATVADWAREVIAASDRLEAGVAALRGRRNAHIRISASMTIAEYIVPGWLSHLRKRSPGVTVALRVCNSRHVIEDVLSGSADLGFIEGIARPDELSNRVIGADELAVVVAPGHAWDTPEAAIDIPTLSAGPLVLRETGSGTREALERALSRHGMEVEPALELGSTAAVKGAVLSGEGAAVLSEMAVIDDVESGRLRRVEVEGLDLHRKLRMVWLEGTKIKGAAAELAQLVCAPDASKRPA